MAATAFSMLLVGYVLCSIALINCSTELMTTAYAPLIPTFAGAIDIFELKQLEKVKVETQQSQGGLYVAIVQLYDRGRDLSRAGASQDRDEVVAEWLAFSNAVRQITF